MILSVNRCYYAYGKLMKSRVLKRSSKLKICKSLIRPIVTYECEAWTLTNRDEQYLRIFEGRILRKIFGPVQNEDGFWRIRMNDVIKKRSYSEICKKQKNGLAGSRDMDRRKNPKRVLEWKPIGRRNRGRPRKRRIEDIEEDIQIMGMRGWRKFCKERAEWKKITEKAKTHSGL
jgi:hypothetical protein